MPERTRAVYVISVAAELAGMHPQTLRIYERKGLVAPARTGGNSRRYSQDDIDMLRRIQELTSEGLNLAGVQRVMELEEQLRTAQAELERVRTEMAERQREIDLAVAAARREQRRDLVPLRQEVVVYSATKRQRGS
jgi:MerR family transcriptional regulator/heat shock protein HspR